MASGSTRERLVENPARARSFFPCRIRFSLEWVGLLKLVQCGTQRGGVGVKANLFLPIISPCLWESSDLLWLVRRGPLKQTRLPCVSAVLWTSCTPGRIEPRELAFVLFGHFVPFFAPGEVQGLLTGIEEHGGLPSFWLA